MHAIMKLEDVLGCLRNTASGTNLIRMKCGCRKTVSSPALIFSVLKKKKKKRLWCFVCHDEDVGIALISSVLEDFVYKWQVVRMYKKLRNFGVGGRGR